MALTQDTVSVANSGAGEINATFTWNHTVSGLNNYLFIGVAFRTDASQTVSAVTWNTTETMVFIGGVSNGSTRSELWGLVNPTTGAHAVLVTFSAATAAVVAGGSSWNGADQTGTTNAATIGTAVTASATNSSVSNTASSAAGEIVQDAIAVSSLVSVSSCGQSQDWLDIDAGGQTRRGAGSHANGAASVNMNWTLSASGAWASVAVPLKPAAASNDIPPGLGSVVAMSINMQTSNQTAMMR